jgi:hypothetical protein
MGFLRTPAGLNESFGMAEFNARERTMRADRTKGVRWPRWLDRRYSPHTI